MSWVPGRLVVAGDAIRFMNLSDPLIHRVLWVVNDSGRACCGKWFWPFRLDDNNGAVTTQEAVTCMACLAAAMP